MRVVLDTNIFISGIFWKGNPNKIVSEWRNGKFTLVSSMELVKELINTLKDFKIALPEEIIKEWIDLIIMNSELVIIKNELKAVEDPDDDKFIETALAGSADFIITQDKHLLKIKEYNNIKILTPTEFLKII